MAADPKAGPEANSTALAEQRWTAIAAILALAILGGTFAWWALEDGAYFGDVMYPGLALLAAGLIVLMATAPWRASLAMSGPARLALFSLVGLGIWSLASALWSPTPDIAVEDAQRIVGYALSFALGIWGCTLLGRRMELSVLPVVGAAGFVGRSGTLAAIALTDRPLPFLEEDGTLQYPLGYRNANAAFFLMALWPALRPGRFPARSPGRSGSAPSSRRPRASSSRSSRKAAARSSASASRSSSTSYPPAIASTRWPGSSWRWRPPRCAVTRRHRALRRCEGRRRSRRTLWTS